MGHRGNRHRGRGNPQSTNSGGGYLDRLVEPLGKIIITCNNNNNSSNSNNTIKGEAMSAGAIPIVFNHGAACDIVSHGRNGFLANNLVDYAKTTLYLLDDAKDKEISMLRRGSTQVMYNYSKEKFLSALKTIIFRGLTSRHLRKYIKTYYPGNHITINTTSNTNG